MLDYKLIVKDNLDDFYAQEECAVARLAINLNTAGEKILLQKRNTQH